MSTPRRPDLDRPPPSAPHVLRRSWPILVGVAVVLVALVPALLTRGGRNSPAGVRDLTPSCESLPTVQSSPPVPRGLPVLDGQFVYQTGQLGRTQFTFTAVPNPDLDAVVSQLTRQLQTAGYSVTVTQPAPPLPSPVRGYAQVERSAVLTVRGPNGQGTVTVGGRCTNQSDIGYALTP